MSFQYKIRGEQFVQFERQSQDYIEERDQDLESSLNYDFSNLDADNLTSGTVPSARIAGSYTGFTAITVDGVNSSPITIGDYSASNLYSAIEGNCGYVLLGKNALDDFSVYLRTNNAISNVNIGVNNGTTLSVGGSSITVTGTAIATTFSGSGASLTSIPNSATTAVSTNTPSTIVSRSSNGNFSANNITANGFIGDGSSLTSIPAGQLTGTVASARISGSYTGITGVGTLAAGSIPATLLTGTIASARISGGYTGINDVGTLTSGLSVSGNVLNSVFSINITGSGNEFVAVNPGTGSGNAAHWVFVSPNYRLYRNTSTIREKENIQSVGNLLNPNMIDAINVQLWNRKTAPGIPEVGPIAEEMDAISPFLSTRGLEWDDDGAPIPSPIDGINNNSWLSLLTIGMQDIRQRLQQLETQ